MLIPETGPEKKVSYRPKIDENNNPWNRSEMTWSEMKNTVKSYTSYNFANFATSVKYHAEINCDTYIL